MYALHNFNVEFTWVRKFVVFCHVVRNTSVSTLEVLGYFMINNEVIKTTLFLF